MSLSVSHTYTSHILQHYYFLNQRAATVSPPIIKLNLLLYKIKILGHSRYTRDCFTFLNISDLKRMILRDVHFLLMENLKSKKLKTANAEKEKN